MRQYDYLIDALKNGLWPRYCIEPNWNGYNLAIPMVCFCDIPLSQVKTHVGRYGKYGIGVTKEFAKRNNITPVMYVEAVSKLKKKGIDKVLSTEISHVSEEMGLDHMMLCYIKRVEGQDNKNKRVKFYDEREWRYVPDLSNEIRVEVNKNKDEICIKKLCIKTKDIRLKLSPKDILYLIVKDESHVIKLYDDLDKYFKEFNQGERNKLKTRIICTQQISKDF